MTISKTVEVIGTTAQQSGEYYSAQITVPINTADNTTDKSVDRSTAPSRGLVLVAVLTAYCLLITLIFYDTLMSMVSVWMNSETYTHGFLIAPISLWLAWRMRDRFHELVVRPEPWALLLILGAGTAWVLANIVDVLLIQRLAFVAMLVSGIWAIAGTAVVRCYIFPLGFLFLAVPMGSELILPLMILTADTTEFLLRVSGIPVFRDGMYLYLPTGTWSVVEECSGVRYVIASVTLGLCYAHLNYTSLWRQAAFVLAAIVLPVVANSLRAYSVVMIGHLSDMRYGTGYDHLVFGWVLFGVVMLLMFWVGSFWQQDEKPAATSTESSPSPQKSTVLSLTAMTAVALVCAGLWPAVAYTMNRSNNLIDVAALTAPLATGTWQAVDSENWQWHPAAQDGVDRELDQVYAHGAADQPIIVGLHLRQYLQQQQGAELVDTFYSPWRPDPAIWRIIEEQRPLSNIDQPARVMEARVVSAHGSTLLIWSWYHIDGRHTANPYLVKILEAKQQILSGNRQGTRVFIATAVDQDRDQARQVLRDFINDLRPSIETSLRSGIGAPLSRASSEGVAQ